MAEVTPLDAAQAILRSRLADDGELPRNEDGLYVADGTAPDTLLTPAQYEAAKRVLRMRRAAP